MCVASLPGPDRPPADLSRLKRNIFQVVERKEEREGGGKSVAARRHMRERETTQKLQTNVCSPTCSRAREYVSQTTTRKLDCTTRQLFYSILKNVCIKLF